MAAERRGGRYSSRRCSRRRISRLAATGAATRQRLDFRPNCSGRAGWASRPPQRRDDASSKRPLEQVQPPIQSRTGRYGSPRIPSAGSSWQLLLRSGRSPVGRGPRGLADLRERRRSATGPRSRWRWRSRVVEPAVAEDRNRGRVGRRLARPGPDFDRPPGKRVPISVRGPGRPDGAPPMIAATSAATRRPEARRTIDGSRLGTSAAIHPRSSDPPPCRLPLERENVETAQGIGESLRRSGDEPWSGPLLSVRYPTSGTAEDVAFVDHPALEDQARSTTPTRPTSPSSARSARRAGYEDAVDILPAPTTHPGGQRESREGKARIAGWASPMKPPSCREQPAGGERIDDRRGGGGLGPGRSGP